MPSENYDLKVETYNLMPEIKCEVTTSKDKDNSDLDCKMTYDVEKLLMKGTNRDVTIALLTNYLIEGIRELICTKLGLSDGKKAVEGFGDVINRLLYPKPKKSFPVEYSYNQKECMLKISVDDKLIAEVEVPENKTKKVGEYFAKRRLTDYFNGFIKVLGTN